MSSCRLPDLPDELEKLVYRQRERILALRDHPMILFKLVDLLRETIREGMTTGRTQAEIEACTLPHPNSRVCAFWYDGCHCEEPYDKEASTELVAAKTKIAALEQETVLLREEIAADMLRRRDLETDKSRLISAGLESNGRAREVQSRLSLAQEALRKYGRHRRGDGLSENDLTNACGTYRNGVCTCGLDKALSALEEKTP